jgi:hypothetical protein
MGNSASSSSQEFLNQKHQELEKSTITTTTKQTVDKTYLNYAWEKQKECKNILLKLNLLYDKLMKEKTLNHSDISPKDTSKNMCEELKLMGAVINDFQIFPSPVVYKYNTYNYYYDEHSYDYVIRYQCSLGFDLIEHPHHETPMKIDNITPKHYTV